MKKDWAILSDLCGDAYCDRADKLSVLAAALDFISKGTKYRKDAIEIIKGCCPYYFEKDDSQNFDMIYRKDENGNTEEKRL